jgi:hypothetical protein
MRVICPYIRTGIERKRERKVPIYIVYRESESRERAERE